MLQKPALCEPFGQTVGLPASLQTSKHHLIVSVSRSQGSYPVVSFYVNSSASISNLYRAVVKKKNCLIHASFARPKSKGSQRSCYTIFYGQQSNKFVNVSRLLSETLKQYLIGVNKQIIEKLEECHRFSTVLGLCLSLRFEYCLSR